MTIGCTFDGLWWAPLAEATRCTIVVIALRHIEIMENWTYFDKSLLYASLSLYFGLSALVWGILSLSILTSKKNFRLNVVIDFLSDVGCFPHEIDTAKVK